MPGTVEQREQALREIKERNKKDVFELPPELQMIGNPVKIYNVGPFRHQRSMGSYGQFTIQACPEGEEISIPLEIPYITNDPVHIDMFQMAHRHDSGRKLALDILGIGQFHTPEEDLTKWGCFVAKGQEPTEKEIADAKAKLIRTYDWLITEADNYYNQGPSSYANIVDMHRLAARARGQKDKPWAKGIEQLKNCPFCGSGIQPAAIICPTCKNSLDDEKVIAARLRGFEHLWKKPRPAEV
jgi:hypothetical protein